MFVPKNHEVTMRCPVCFNREIDVLMKYENNKYSCIKCSFHGTEAEVRAAYKDIQKKFTKMGKRVDIEAYDKL